jgi:hypothetical protein
MAVVLTVFCALGFLLAIAVEAANEQLSLGGRKASPPVEVFDASPITDLIQPAPSYSPEEVVEIQTGGLASSDVSRGIQQCFAFASPSNRQMTGPIARFAVMVRRPPYAALMRNRLKLLGSPVIDGDSASVVVTLLDDHNAIHVFQFLLSKQHGNDVENCWMTDAVYPLEQKPHDPAGHPTNEGTAGRTQAGRISVGFSVFYESAHV